MGRTRKSRGLGDDIETVLKKTGMQKLAHAVIGEDCGCEERKSILNRWFPHIKNYEITEDQKKTYEVLKSGWSGTVTSTWRKDFYAFFNEVTMQNKRVSSCSSCVKRDWNFLNAIMSACEHSNNQSS
jgi:hypothetical protein